MLTCQKCGGQNRRGAKFCSSCGADLSPMRSMSPSEAKRSDSSESGKGMVSSLVQSAVGLLAGTKSQPAEPPQSAPPATPATTPLPVELSAAQQPATKPMGTEQVLGPLTPLPPGSVLSHPNDPSRRYSIAKA